MMATTPREKVVFCVYRDSESGEFFVARVTAQGAREIAGAFWSYKVAAAAAERHALALDDAAVFTTWPAQEINRRQTMARLGVDALPRSCWVATGWWLCECGHLLPKAPGGSGGVTCPHCGARWDFDYWRADRWPGDACTTGLEPRRMS